jgi:hypothetical protein
MWQHLVQRQQQPQAGALLACHQLRGKKLNPLKIGMQNLYYRKSLSKFETHKVAGG